MRRDEAPRASGSGRFARRDQKVVHAELEVTVAHEAQARVLQQGPQRRQAVVGLVIADLRFADQVHAVREKLEHRLRGVRRHRQDDLSARTQHPGDLLDHRARMRKMLQHGEERHHVERRVGEGQRVGQRRRDRGDLGGRNARRLEVDADSGFTPSM